MVNSININFKLITILAITFICMVSACSNISQPAKERDFSTMDLLISESDMPDGWFKESDPGDITDSIVAVTEASAIDFIADTEFHRKNASLGIYRYGNEEEAAWLFKRQHSGYGEPPDNWVEPVTSANQSYFGCANYPEPDPTACTWAAQYEEYIISFDTWLIPGYMSYSDIMSVIKAIDARIVKYLYY